MLPSLLSESSSVCCLRADAGVTESLTEGDLTRAGMKYEWGSGMSGVEDRADGQLVSKSRMLLSCLIMQGLFSNENTAMMAAGFIYGHSYSRRLI